MKISLGLAASAALAAVLFAGLCASADPAPRYDMTGRVCTAEEVAKPPIVKVRASKRIVKVRMDCRTAADWRSYQADIAEKNRARLASQNPFPGPTFGSSEAVTIRASQ